MPERCKRLPEAAGMLLLLALIGGILYLLFLYPGDISARQTEGRRIFGAACMTMNNPYYQVLDSCLRSEIEAGGGRPFDPGRRHGPGPAEPGDMGKPEGSLHGRDPSGFCLCLKMAVQFADPALSL